MDEGRMMYELPKRGEIHSQEAYALGKMVDSSSWSLPRGITPSDIDLVFDNAGDMLACELSRKTFLWSELPVGQRLVYERFVLNGCARHIAAVCKHNVAPEFGRKIDSRNDVVQFQLMVYMEGNLVMSNVRDDWPEFVEKEFYGTRKAFSDYAQTC